jgi:hypothetical protein
MTLKEIIQSPEQFEALMREINEELKEEQVPIEGRSIAALGKVSEKYHCTLGWTDEEGAQISRWFHSRYGDRMKMNFDIGKTLVCIDGDIYSVSLPMILGQMKVNPFKWIDRASPNLLNSLSEEELGVIQEHLIDHYRAYNKFKYTPAEHTADLIIAVDQMMIRNPEFGLSKWASLQASEKILKGYIRVNGGTPPRGGKHGHDITFLIKQANALGLPVINSDIISDIQCTAGVRYEHNLTQQDAYSAYCSSIILCKHVAEELPIE